MSQTAIHERKQSRQLAYPPTRLVEVFDSMASLGLKRIQAFEEESGRLAELRDTLLPTLISGELRVSHAERLVMKAGV